MFLGPLTIYMGKKKHSDLIFTVCHSQKLTLYGKNQTENYIYMNLVILRMY